MFLGIGLYVPYMHPVLKSIELFLEAGIRDLEWVAAWHEVSSAYWTRLAKGGNGEPCWTSIDIGKGDEKVESTRTWADRS